MLENLWQWWLKRGSRIWMILIFILLVPMFFLIVVWGGMSRLYVDDGWCANLKIVARGLPVWSVTLLMKMGVIGVAVFTLGQIFHVGLLIAKRARRRARQTI